MIISLGSKNPVKVDALSETLLLYDFLKDAQVVKKDVPSGVSDQPKSMDETILGAKNRAAAAFADCTYSFGIESGLM